jgi:uncharacterized protein
MTIWGTVALAIVGFAVGTLAGLVGIGGGVLIVPFLYFFYSHPAWSGITLAPELHATVAHATSLFIIVPTAIVGTLTYHRNRVVAWRAAIPIALFSVLSAAGGALIAARVPAEWLKLGFGFFLLFTASQMVRKRKVADPDAPLRINFPAVAATGLLVGMFSALLGVGGGLVAIPLLMNVMHLDVKRLAATSLAIVTFAATSGTITYMTAADVGSGYVGLVHVAAALPMLPGAMLAARWGARLNQKLDPARLKRIFAVLFLLMGLRIIIANLITLLQR